MKRNMLKKVFSLVLVSIMLMSAFSTVLASDTTENGQVAALSGEGPVSGIFGKVGGWLLEKLAGGAVSYVGGKGMNALLGSMFGSDSDPSSEQYDHAAAAEKFLSEIQGVKDDVAKLKEQINTLSGLLIGKMNYGELKKDLDDFAIYINQYIGAYNDLCDAQKSYANDAELTEWYANKIYFGEDRNLWVDGKTTYNATIALGNRLVLVLQGGYNIFGAFDKMDRYINRWENQGYASRHAFRENLIKIYAQYSAMSKLACKVVYAQADGSIEGRGIREMAVNRWNQLSANAEMVLKMYERCAVVEHPDYRIYRDTDTGTDLYAFHASITDCKMRTIDYTQGMEYFEWKFNMQFNSKVACIQDYIIFYDVWYTPHEEYMLSMIGTKSPYIPEEFIRTDYNRSYSSGEVVVGYSLYPNTFYMLSSQPDYEDYLRIYSDYKKDNPGKQISMFDIFFSEEEGAFINNTGRYGPKLKKGAQFATCYYQFTYFFNGEKARRWKTNVVTEYGEVVKDYTLGVYTRKTNQSGSSLSGPIGSDSYIDNTIFFNITKYTGPELNQGNLKAPSLPQYQSDGLITGMAASYNLPYSDSVTLSVEEKPGATYQWYIDKGNGNEPTKIENAVAATYTLPTLEASMNGWRYWCDITENEGTDQEICTTANLVILKLTGEGIPEPVMVHDVSTAGELDAALDKVSDGIWDGHTIKLTADITYPNPITLLESGLTIDLNGHTLTVQPNSDSEPNINPMSNMAKTAAIYSLRGNLYVNGEGALNVIAGQGIDYGVYVYASEVTVGNVTCTDGGTAIYATDGGSVEITGDVSAKGENAYSIECFGGCTVKVSGNVNAEGHTSCGIYAESYNGQNALVEVGGNVIVSGDDSRAAFLNADYTVLKVQGNVTVTGAGASGISAGGGDGENRCTAIIYSDVAAPKDGVNAWDGADVRVYGNVTVTDKYATAVSATGALVQLRGNVTSEGKEGTGIHASAWDLADSVVGAMVKSDVKITAFKPLLIKGIIVEESEHSNESVYAGYYTFTDGTNTVWAKPGSFVKISGSDSDTTPSPQTGDASNIVLYTFILFSSAGIIAMIFYTKKRHMVSPANRL